MNLKFLYSYIPQKKCGALAVGAGIGAGGMLASSLVNSVSTSKANKANISNQRSENAINRQFSHDEADLDRNWQADQWLKQYNLQRDEWYKQQQTLADQSYQQFLKEASYNSPTNQVQRLSQAGLNPSAVLSGNGSGLVSAATGNLHSLGSPSVPSGGSVPGAMANPMTSPLPQQRPLDLSFIGSMFRDISEGTKTNKTLIPLLDQMTAQTNLYLQQVVGQELSNQYQAVANQVASITKNAKINQAYADLGYTYAESFLKYKQGDEIDSKILVNKSVEFLNSIKSKCSQEEYLQLVFAVDHMDETYRNMLSNDSSQRSLNYANAENARQSAVDTEQTRDYRKQLLQAQTELTSINHELGKNQDAFEDATFANRVDTVLSELERSQALTDDTRQKIQESRERIKSLRKDRKWVDAKNVTDMVSKYVNSAFTALKMF